MPPLNSTLQLLLRRQGLAHLPTPAGGAPLEPRYVQAVGIKLAALGYVPSTRLDGALARLSLTQLADWQDGAYQTLAAHVGADKSHTPLFSQFPKGVPTDTRELWVRKVLTHYLQQPDQTCLFCRRPGTCHVLSPCLHVICDHCFDGANYTACPVCEHHVDRSSPFFRPAVEERRLPQEVVQFKLLDVGSDADAEAQQLFASFCARKQALSPADVQDFATLITDYRERVLPWLPAEIPVRENVAHVFGTLLRLCDPLATLALARPHLKSATDVLRVIAVFSGADPALAAQPTYQAIDVRHPPKRWRDVVAKYQTQWKGWLQAHALPFARTVHIPFKAHRFKMAKLRRPLRRALLETLEQFRPDLLTEDMLRHRSYWVWVGEFLHPHEYHKRYPHVAQAFAIVRGQTPDGTPAPEFHTYYARLETAAELGDSQLFNKILRERPGELARRFDHALRVAGDNPQAARETLGLLVEQSTAFSTPVLLTLRNLLACRTSPAKVRLFWPKGGTTQAVSASDRRPPLSPEIVTPAIAAIEAELLRRLTELPAFESAVIDRALATVIVPFNERTASPAAVNLPRGSRIPVPAGKFARMFLYWRQPERGGCETDLDLSVGCYDANWSHVGVCSYYQLQLQGKDGGQIARSSGDLRDAPYPQGATEFVDLDCERALADGIRYAVMVVTAYAGLPFSQLESAFAGLMLRQDADGKRFDPRTVELRFNLQGEHGVFMPLVFDLQERRLDWLDVYARGMFEFNNVANANHAIATVCPNMQDYFGSGVRMSMFDLALLHAAARCQRVTLRGEGLRVFDRQPGEGAASFLARLKEGTGARETGELDVATGAPVMAALFKGDLDLPPESWCYALFRERVTAPVAASDWIAGSAKARTT